MQMIQLKSSEYSEQKVIKCFDVVDGRMRPKNPENYRSEESKKTMQLKKKVKMKKHNGFKSENEEAKAQLVQSLTLTKIERHKWLSFSVIHVF